MFILEFYLVGEFSEDLLGENSLSYLRTLEL